MTETAVVLHLLEHLEVITELRVETVGEDLRVCALLDVFLSVEHPHGDLEVRGVLHDGDDLVDLLGLELTGSPVSVDVGLLADHASKTGADTSDGCEGKDDLLLTVDVRVEHTEDVLEVCVGNKGL